MTDTSTREVDGETWRLAEFCSSIDGAELSEYVRTEAGAAVLDTIGACVAGVDTSESERMRAYVRTASTGGEAKILGTSERTSPEFAALANGTSAHALETDDGHRGASAHPGAAVLPAALAVLPEADTADGNDLTAAVVGGYEAMLKIGRSVQPSHRERHFHATATLGCFGAAAAAGRILELDRETFAHALGLAGTQAGGLFEFLADGSMVKRFHPGRAAMAGVMATRLAIEGFDGPATIVEGEDGFAAAFASEFDFAPLRELGDPYEITRTYRKPYPCCRHLHAAIDACVSIRDAGANATAIDTVSVETYDSASKHDKTDVQTTLDAQMSMPHAVSTALIDGIETLNAFSDPVTSDLCASLRERIRIVADPEMDARYPATRSTRVIVVTDDGTRYEETVAYPLGAPENPLGATRLESKLHDLASPRLPDENRRQLIELTGDLSTVDHCRKLVDVACP